MYNLGHARTLFKAYFGLLGPPAQQTAISLGHEPQGQSKRDWTAMIAV